MILSFPKPQRLQRRDYLLLSLFILLGALLRFYNLSGTGFSNDELSALNRLRFSNFHSLIQFGVMPDGHPAGVQVFLWYYTRWLGDTAFIVRFPFGLAGVLCIPLAFIWVRKWFGIWPAHFTAASFAILQFFIYYSEIARPYSLGLLWILLLICSWTALAAGRQRWWLYAFFVLSLDLCAYTHYFSFLQAVLIGIAGLFFVPHKKKYILACVIAILLYLPHLPILFAQMKLGGLLWLGHPDRYFLKGFLLAVADDSNWVIIIAFLILILSLLSKHKTKNYLLRLLALLLFLLPYIIGYIKSTYGKPVLQLSSMLFGFPFLLAFWFSFTGRLWPATRYLLLAAWTMVGLYALIFQNRFYTTEQYSQFQYLATQILHWNDSLGTNHITNVANINHPYYFQYYYQHWHRKQNFAIYRFDDSKGLDSLFQVVRRSHTPYLSFAWSNIGHPPQAGAIIRLRYQDTLYYKKHYLGDIGLFSITHQDSLIPLWRQSTQDGFLFIPYKPAWNNHLLRIRYRLDISTAAKGNMNVALYDSNHIIFTRQAGIEDQEIAAGKNKEAIFWISLPNENKDRNDSLKINILQGQNIRIKGIQIEIY